MTIYLSLDWQNDEMVASRYMFCLLQNPCRIVAATGVFCYASAEQGKENNCGKGKPYDKILNEQPI